MAEVLFCPFCRESFEGERECPEHELALVPFFDLPGERRALGDDERVAWHSPALGRGPVAAAALAKLIAFATMPLSRVEGPTAMGGTMLRLASESTPKLWLVPAAALAILAILLRRRTPVGLRGVRVLVPLLALVAPATVLWSWSGISEAMALLSERSGQRLTPRLALGAYVVLAASLPCLVFGLRLGTQRRGRARWNPSDGS